VFRQGVQAVNQPVDFRVGMVDLPLDISLAPKHENQRT
jgi:hypothetical protein